MSTRVASITLVSAGLLVVCFWVNIVSAGLINHKVKVTNTLQDSAVIVILNYGTGGDHLKQYTINPQSSHTFGTGAKCPISLRGFVLGHYQLTMIARCTGGREGNVETRGCMHTCWSSDWVIRRHDDGAFHFDKE